MRTPFLCSPRAGAVFFLKLLLTCALGATGGCANSASSDASGAGSSIGTGASGTGTGNQPGTGGAGAVQIPVNPPSAVLVPTSRVIRLSHSQWINTVKDLLKLPDISVIASAVTGDAVVGFDNDGESLFVDAQLREDLQAAAVSRRAPRSTQAEMRWRQD